MNLVLANTAFIFRVIGLCVPIFIFDFISGLNNEDFSKQLLLLYGHGFVVALIFGFGFQVSINRYFVGKNISIGQITKEVVFNLLASYMFYCLIVLIIGLYSIFYGFNFALSIFFISSANLALYLISYAAQSKGNGNSTIIFLFLVPSLNFLAVTFMGQRAGSVLAISLGVFSASIIVLLFITDFNWKVRRKFTLYSFYGGVSPLINITGIWILPLSLVSSLNSYEQALFMVTLRLGSLVNIFTGVINQTSVSKIVQLSAQKNYKASRLMYLSVLQKSVFSSIVMYLLIFFALSFKDFSPLLLPNRTDFSICGLFYICSVLIGPVGVFMQHSNMAKELSGALLISLVMFLMLSAVLVFDFQQAMYFFGAYLILTNFIAFLILYNKSRSWCS